MRRDFSALLLAAMLLLAAPVLVAADSEFSLDKYDGKVVVLDFWASWCAPCRRSFPWLNEMHRKYEQDGLIVIGVNLDANEDDAIDFLKDYPADFRIIFDTDAALATEFGVEAMPSSFVIDRNGELTTSHRGFKVKQQAEYEAILVEALGEQP